MMECWWWKDGCLEGCTDERGAWQEKRRSRGGYFVVLVLRIRENSAKSSSVMNMSCKGILMREHVHSLKMHKFTQSYTLVKGDSFASQIFAYKSETSQIQLKYPAAVDAMQESCERLSMLLCLMCDRTSENCHDRWGAALYLGIRLYPDENQSSEGTLTFHRE